MSNLNITLPDGRVEEFPVGISGLDIANRISAGLAKQAVAIIVDGNLQDLTTTIDVNANVVIVTAKDKEGLEVIRHSCAHILAQAVKSIYPDAQVTIGPVIEDGFYYDFYYPKGFSEDDLVAIETKMFELVANAAAVTRSIMKTKDAIDYFSSIGEKYKAEIIKDLGVDVVTVYDQGGFKDLCRGPHVPHLGLVKAFKLTSVAGAYWRGDSSNVMLQRIYGTAWANAQQLKQYLHLKEEAKKRDHRLLAKKMDLFHIQPESPGMVFWHANGWSMYQALKDYVRSKYLEYGYGEVSTPQLVDNSLWQQSGHLDKFSDNMFSVIAENKTYALKPMNCPCHVQIFNYNLRSYRDLPLRIAEMGSCHRNEPSGTLHGLMRVRNFIQDDGHIFCTKSQVSSEVVKFIQQITAVYQDFGFNEFKMRLSTRPEVRVGADEIWDISEQALRDVLNSSGLDWELCPGEGAFYGPKIEFVLQDCLGRNWQCGTVQLDFSMPEKLRASYIDADGSKQIPVMIHRAMLGSLERFLGILLEDTAGNLPVWLAPVQVAVLSISEDLADYAKTITEQLVANGVRALVDVRNEKIGLKIREHSIKRVAFIAICGKKEKADNKVALRNQLGDNLGAVSCDSLIELIKSQGNSKLEKNY